jgi:pilus assembly protein CpaC
MRTRPMIPRVALLILVLTLLVPASGSVCLAGDSARIVIDRTMPRPLDLVVGKSVIIEDPGPGDISFTSAAPEIVEVMRLPTGQIYLRGKTAGITSLSVCERDRVSAVFDITVTPDVTLLRERLSDIMPQEKDLLVMASNDMITIYGKLQDPTNLGTINLLAQAYAPKEKIINLLSVPRQEKSMPKVFLLKEKIHEILPREKEVRVTAAGDKIMLSGKVTSAAALAQVMALTEAYSPAEKILNLLEVGGVQQVMLEVRVAEMSRSLIRRLGFNFAYLSSSGQNFGLSLLNNLVSLPAGETLLPDPGNASSPINAIFRFLGNEGTEWTLFVDALKETGLVHVLAEPTLITLSGQSASFLAGGEFPVPVPQSDNNVTIEYKEFGVGLAFTPTVLDDGKISMKVVPEVSELDFTSAVSFAGFVVPGVKTRRVSTVIELADGQSFAIAGLLQNNVREIVSKFPILGDIPVLGALFRSSSFQKNESELVIIATPHLVKPLDMSKQTLPTDHFIEPTDAEFYLMGAMEGRPAEETPGRTSSPQASAGGLEGDFGHIIPQ